MNSDATEKVASRQIADGSIMARKCILVIDDEPAIQVVIQGCLEDIAGWAVLRADSGPEGIRVAMEKQPDAILLDVTMPEMDGIETLQQLRENPLTYHIPVAFLTAKVQPEDQQQFAAVGAAGLIIKPFNPMQLITQVVEVFDW